MIDRHSLPGRRLAIVALLVGALSILVALARVRAAADRAGDVPFSPLTAGRRVGADYLDRRGIPTLGPVPGEVDDLSALYGPDFDPEAVHPAVRRFYERTAEYDLAYRVTWHRGFRLGAALATRLARRIGQLALPGPRWLAGGSGGDGIRGAMTSRLVRIDPAADPREGARAWIRTDADTGRSVFVAVYALHRRGGTVYTNIAAPLPRSNLSTVLRVEALPVPSAAGGDGLRLTTRHGDGDEGLYLVTPVGAVALPLEQTFEVRPAGSSGATSSPSDAAVEVVATHRMAVYGRRFLTIEYAARRIDESSREEG